VIGVDPAAIVPIALVPGVPDAPARFAAVAADWIEDSYGADYFSWQEHGHRAPYDLLALAFSRDELVRLWHDCIFASKLDDHLEEHDALVWKVRHSLWRYGCSRDYARFVACHNGSRVSRSTCRASTCESRTRGRSTRRRGRRTGARTRSTSTRRSACSCTTAVST
jgi:hypothetical protein